MSIKKTMAVTALAGALSVSAAAVPASAGENYVPKKKSSYGKTYYKTTQVNASNIEQSQNQEGNLNFNLATVAVGDGDATTAQGNQSQEANVTQGNFTSYWK